MMTTWLNAEQTYWQEGDCHNGHHPLKHVNDDRFIHRCDCGHDGWIGRFYDCADCDALIKRERATEQPDDAPAA